MCTLWRWLGLLRSACKEMPVEAASLMTATSLLPFWNSSFSWMFTCTTLKPVSLHFTVSAIQFGTVSVCLAVNARQCMTVNRAFLSLHFSVSIISWFAAGKLGIAAWPASKSQGHVAAELTSQVAATSRHFLGCTLNRPALSTSTAYTITAELCLAMSLASSAAGRRTALPGSLLLCSVFMQVMFCVSPYLDECPRQI